jgi:hypothetical protein
MVFVGAASAAMLSPIQPQSIAAEAAPTEINSERCGFYLF